MTTRGATTRSAAHSPTLAPALRSGASAGVLGTGEPRSPAAERSGASTLHPPRTPIELRVTIQRTADAEKDKKLLSWVYDLLRGRPGTDRFCIIVRKNGSAMQLDFPNDTTEFTPALEQQLTRRLGAGSVEVKESLP